MITFFWEGQKHLEKEKVALYFSCTGLLFCEAITAYYIRKYIYINFKHIFINENEI